MSVSHRCSSQLPPPSTPAAASAHYWLIRAGGESSELNERICINPDVIDNNVIHAVKSSSTPSLPTRTCGTPEESVIQ